MYPAMAAKIRVHGLRIGPAPDYDPASAMTEIRILVAILGLQTNEYGRKQLLYL